MSSLKATYQAYLSNPTADALAENASLNYITTLTTLNTAVSIVKHHAAHSKVLTKKEEKTLSCIEGNHGLCLDVETTLEFLTGGGAYLPGLDDNFLADRVVTFPIMHVVHFDVNRRIQQIRLYWDQGSLLKLVDVIGARARNWPIRDGKDQARLIASSVAGITQSNGSSRPSTAKSGDPNDTPIANKSRSPNKNVTRDPHASLALFAPREEEEASSQLTAPRAPKAQSANPTPRDYHDLFVGNESDASPRTTKTRAASPTKEASGPRHTKGQSANPAPRDYHDLFVDNEIDASSPQKENMTPGPVAPKAGAGKNFKPSRLFDTEDSQNGKPGSGDNSTDKMYKPHPDKYKHFELGEKDDNPRPMATRPKSKHQNNWDFDDSSGPEKVPTRVRGQDVRHFGWSGDGTIIDSPAKNPHVAKARPDASWNFELQDDGTPAGGRRPAGHPRGPGNIKGAGLYQNNVFDEELPRSTEKEGHSQTTESRNRDDKENFQMRTDNSKSTGIKTGGDGMGGKKGGTRSWGFGDESDGEGEGGVNGRKFQASKIQQAPKDNDFWDF